jgi:hypothetical protein
MRHLRFSLARCAATLAAAVALVTLPATAHAQFGGMGGMGGMGRRGGMGGRGGGMEGGGGRQGARRAEPLINSVDLILKHGTELALTDSQVVRLTSVKTHQDSAIATIKARLDSLAGPRGGDSAGTRDPMSVQDRMQARGETMVAYREALTHGRDDAFAVLEKKQRKQAEKFEDALKKEMQDAEPADDRGGWGGRSGDGRRGGYPER